MVLAVLAAVLIGQARKPVDTGEPSTAIVGTYTYDKLQIGTLQIQGFPALTKSEKQKMSYHITPKAVCGYPASGFFAWIA